MKHFFHQRQPNHDALLEHVLSGFNEADITEQLKILYDATDIIHDKRLPEADGELETCFKEYKKRLFTEPFNKEIDKKQLKYKALLSLWRCAETLGEELTSDETWILFHLTRGNLCNRLSQYFYDQQDFDNSEIWGDRAIEIIWHGINQNTKDDVYLRLLQLNLSTYYVDYSRRNQRSNYTSAELELTKLLKGIEVTDKSNLSNKIQRQYSLIELEAKYDLIAITRRRFHNKEACNASEDFNHYVESLTEKATHLDYYDLQRYRLLAKLGLARVYRDMHTPKYYKEAIKLAVSANKLSDNEKVNIDALIIISSILRKALKFSPEKFDDIVPDVKKLFSDGLNGLFKKLSELANVGHSYSMSELIKWYCMGMNQGLVQKKISKEKSFPTAELIDGYLTQSSEQVNSNKRADSSKYTDNSDYTGYNIQLQFLKGLVLLNTHQYNKARDLFLGLIKHKEADYIRLGTIGLKARYLLASTYISLGHFSRAKSILQDIYNALKEARTYRDESESDAESDMRTIIDLIYCHMRQGNYDKAYDMYCNYYKGKTGKESPIDVDDSFLDEVKKSRRVAGLNNLISCCILATNDDGKMQERLQTAKKILEYLQGYCTKEKFNKNPEINLLRGYFVLLTGEDPVLPSLHTEQINKQGDIQAPRDTQSETRKRTETESDTETQGFGEKEEVRKLTLAHEYFKKACGYQYGFSPIYDLTLDGKEADKAYFSNHAVYVSAYLISLIRLADRQSKKQATIKKFLLGLPKRYEITLNAAIALAEWLLKHAKNDKQLLRSFCFTTICEEHGTMPFNLLHKNKTFRLLASEQRGEIMARLLCFYKYVKTLKEECTYYRSKRIQQIVHYTTTETLKHLLRDGARFRLSNCGYMNDVFEGREFLKCMENVAYVQGTTLRREKSGGSIGLFEKYFPHLERSEKDMRPSGSNVYIGSLSVKEDSFPMWKIYADDEKGCNVEFDEDFFDISGKPYTQSVLSEYLPFRYTEDDYPLYVVQYIGKEFYAVTPPLLTSSSMSTENDVGKNESVASSGEDKPLKHLQDCKTESLHYDRLKYLLKEIYKQWLNFEQYVQDNYDETKTSVTLALRQFIADRLNEVRFLFKSSDYEFEGEVRVVQTAEEAEVNYNLPIPRVYVEINREIKNVTVCLGSRIDDAKVDQLVSWLKHLPCVDKVKLAERNRYVSGSVMGRKKKKTGNVANVAEGNGCNDG